MLETAVPTSADAGLNLDNKSSTPRRVWTKHLSLYHSLKVHLWNFCPSLCRYSDFTRNKRKVF